MAAKAEPEATEAVQSKLAKSLASAIVMGDSHGFDARAAQILDGALERSGDTARRPTWSRRWPTGPSPLSAWTTPQVQTMPSSGRGHQAVEGDRGKVAETLASLDDLEAAMGPY